MRFNLIFSITVALFFTGRTSANGQEIKVQLEQFIDSAKVQSVAKGKYNIYIMNSLDSCLSMYYIKNERELSIIPNPDYYFKFKEEWVMLYADEKNAKYLSSMFDVLPFERQIKVSSKSKLFPTSRGVISGITQSRIICMSSEEVTVSYFRDVYDMPMHFRLLPEPHNIIIEKVYDPEEGILTNDSTLRKELEQIDR